VREISLLISQYINEVSFALRNKHMPKNNVIHDVVKEYMGWNLPVSGWDPILSTTTGNICVASCTDFVFNINNVTNSATGDLTFATTAITSPTTIQGTRVWNHTAATSALAS